MFQCPIYSNKWKNNFGPSPVWYLENNMQQSNEESKRTCVCNMCGSPFM